jgi:hypothetical protein
MKYTIYDCTGKTAPIDNFKTIKATLASAKDFGLTHYEIWSSKDEMVSYNIGGGDVFPYRGKGS